LKYTVIDGKMLGDMLINGAYELENNKENINALNVFPVPDGDTGTNMSATILSAVSEIKKSKMQTAHTISDAAAMGSLMGARGNSGVILSQLLRGFSKQLKDKESITTKDFSLALKEGVNTAYRAVMKPTEGTILTVARETAEKAVEISKHESDFLPFMKALYEKSESSLSKTPDLLPVLKQAGVVDAGGCGFAYLLLGMYKRLQGEVIEGTDVKNIKNENLKETLKADIDTKNIKFGYCTEFFIKTKNADPDKFKKTIEDLGDSIIVVGSDELIKTHIHTNNPGLVLENALKFGELSKVKIDNMREQHRSIIDEGEDSSDCETKEDIAEDKKETKKYAIITVAAGDGIASIFNDLGVDKVIEGGQTMNPSTQDILEAINSVNADNIFVLPNNGNIIMASQQARDVSKKNVYVIPTKSIPQGITAVITFNSDIEPDENQDEMIKAISKVKTGQVTYAVRDTTFNDVEIKEGNVLGIYNGKLVKVGSDIDNVTIDLIDSMIDDESELITVLYGNGLKENDTGKIKSYISDKYKECDANFNYGGQPLYYYIISVE
jgi:DAK2 domain fusion protein YloV